MTGEKTTSRGQVAEVIKKYGRCVELVPIDPNFHNISVGLYIKDDVATVWTFSQLPGVEERMRQIRDQLAKLGGLAPVEGTHNQVRPSCGQFHLRPITLLVTQVVENPPDYSLGKGRIEVRDLRSPLTMIAEPSKDDGRWVYHVAAEGVHQDPAARTRAVERGLVRFGGMEEVEGGGLSFPCGARHDGLVRLVLPQARNIMATQDQLDAAAIRGQMTTGTLGFSQR